MSKPQQPELHRSGLGAAGASGPIPEDNLPGHHHQHEQDKFEGPPAGAAR